MTKQYLVSETDSETGEHRSVRFDGDKPQELFVYLDRAKMVNDGLALQDIQQAIEERVDKIALELFRRRHTEGEIHNHSEDFPNAV